MSRLRAIVIGAGIGGLTTAIALRRAGLEVEVHERATELVEVGAGIGLWANALRALDCIGLGDVIRAAAVPLRGAGVTTWRGDSLVRVDTAELERRFGDMTLVIHRAELLDLLIAALAATPVRLGHACIGFEQNADRVAANFAGGDRASGDLLVGADGLHSSVRAKLHGDVKPVYAGYTAWRAVPRFDHARLRPGETWGPHGRFGHFPVSEGRVYWFASVNTREGERSPDGEKALMRRIFARYHDPIPALIEASPEETILRNDVYDRPPLRRWSEGRVTLLGDAAHPMTPNLGQGACQAIEDAVVLAACLSDGSDVPAALREYQRRRIRRASWIVARSRAFGRIAQLENGALVMLRNAVMPHAAARLQAMELERIVGFEM